MMTQDFRDLIVWQNAMALTRASYALARRLPVEERFALGGQLRRSAASVPANIAEGHSSPHRREFIRYLGIAHASLKELECHVLICVDVGHVEREAITDLLSLADQLSRMLRAMRHALGEPTPKDRLARRADAPRTALPARHPSRSRADGARQHTDRRNRSQS